MYVNHDSASTRYNGIPTACPSTFGCSGDVNLLSWSASTPSINASVRRQPGYKAVTTPAIACENTANIQNCEAVVAGTDDSRGIWAWKFNALSSSGAVLLGGETDDPPSMVGNGLSKNGGFVLAVRGTDERIYIKEKRFVTDGWSPWYNLGAAKTPHPPVVISGADDGQNAYAIFRTKY